MNSGILARRWALGSFYKGIEVNALRLSPRNDPLLYSHRPTPVTVFLRSLFLKDWAKVMEANSPEVWEILDNSYVNFSHFSEEAGHKNAFNSLTTQGLFSLYLRGCAIQCRQGQIGIDLVIPMVVIPRTESLSSQISLSHISAIIIQVKNRNREARSFSRDFLHSKQFDFRHIQGLTPSPTRPYVGIWMSLGAKDNDFSIEGISRPFKLEGKTGMHTDEIEVGQPSYLRMSGARRKTTKGESKHEPVRNNRNCLIQPLEEKGCVPLDRLVIRGRGFEKIYNDAFPLEVLYRLVNRHQFSTSVSGLSFPSDLIREKAMRGVWKLSCEEAIPELEGRFARMDIEKQ